MGSLKEHSTGGKEFTFGVEIEVHVAALLVGAEDPNGDDQRQLYRVRQEVLTDSKLHRDEAKNIMRAIAECVRRETSQNPSREPLDIQLADVEHPVAGGDNPEDSNGTDSGKTVGSLTPNGYQVYQNWTVCFDESGDWYSTGNKRPRPVAPKEYVWFPLEFKSPVCHEFDTLRNELSQIITATRQNFRVSVKCGRGISRTAMHVHVGLRESTRLPNSAETVWSLSEFKLTTMKRLLTLAWLYEPKIMSLHASWKGNHPRYCSTLRRHSHLAGLLGTKLNASDYPPSKNKKLALEEFDLVSATEVKYKESIGDDPERALKIIWGARNMEHLAWLASSQFGERRPALSLHCLAASPSDLIHQTRKVSLKTVEFRHMQGSFDVDDIMNWVQVAVNMVRTYEVSDDGQFRDIVRNAREQNSDVASFFRAIDFPVESNPPFKRQSELDHETDTPGSDGPWDNIFVPRPPLPN